MKGMGGRGAVQIIYHEFLFFLWNLPHIEDMACPKAPSSQVFLIWVIMVIFKYQYD